MSEFQKVFKEYANTFGDNFPMYQLGRDRSEDEVVEMIKRCLDEGKDVYELGYLPDPSKTDSVY